ncbi:ATP-binding protein [Mucilaginibacter sp.]|uniref:ATP-binding protein n=1 Tax=Mucilaginibacter sp. TaxID=1882438 RepID=UPI0025D0FEA4|nr:ATP-binding protein [Mucilaginibacter sp.]
MIVHRDYTHYGDSSVKIFNDHIEFFNPGRLPGDISIANLLSGQYISQARNKKIAATFKEAQLIEKYGSGIKRIQEAFADYGLKSPLFENMQHGFQVTVYSAAKLTSEKTSEKILLMVTQNPTITIAELAANIGISNRSIERNIASYRKRKN